MNWNHIEAMIKGDGIIYRATLDDNSKLISNGFTMLLFADQFETKERVSYPDLVSKWGLASANIGKRITPGELAWAGRTMVRKMGSEWINEAYFRCFDSPEVSWHYGPLIRTALMTSEEHHNLLTVIDGRVVAVSMGVRVRNETTPIADPVDDATLFGPFASERNGFYLITAAKIASEIEDLRGHIEANDEKIKTAEDENSSYQQEIESLERLAKERGLTGK